jgi:hypothetical protein
MPALRPRVLLVGPYERDNLGDLLFPLVMERYLGDAEVVLGAPFAPSTEALLERRVHPYGPLLRDERFDVVWSVGGQLGGVDVGRALRMAAPGVDVLAATGGVELASPYIPALPDADTDTVAVVNSAGLATLRGARPAHRATLVAILRRQDTIAVRDPQSSELLHELGIRHRLAPDAVHALGVLRPRRGPVTNVAAIQVSQRILERLGRDELAQALAGALAPTPLRLRLFAAGVAAGHDDLDELGGLAERIRALAPLTDATVVESRRPWDLVDEIAGAALVVGSSLHVRIIAAAYDRPRISLRRQKVSRYAEYWDPHMPYDVTPQGLAEAVAGAQAHGADPAFAAVSQRIARRADAHLRELAQEALALAAARARRPRRRSPLGAARASSS